MNPAKATKGWELNERDHRKLLVVDGRSPSSAASTSAACTRAAHRRCAPRPATARARIAPGATPQVQIEGPAVAELQKTFVEAWIKTKKEPPPLKNAYPDAQARGQGSGAHARGWGDHKVSAVYVTLLSAVKSARDAPSTSRWPTSFPIRSSSPRSRMPRSAAWTCRSSCRASPTSGPSSTRAARTTRSCSTPA